MKKLYKKIKRSAKTIHAFGCVCGCYCASCLTRTDEGSLYNSNNSSSASR